MNRSLNNYVQTPEFLDYHKGTVYDAFEQTAQLYPENTACIFMGKALSYKQLLSEVRLTADAFSALGVTDGDRVVLALPNLPQTLTAFYALNRIGAVPVMLHPLSAPNRLVACLKENNSSVAVCFDLLYGAFGKALEESGVKVKVLMTSVKSQLSLFGKAYYSLKNRKKLSALKECNNFIPWDEFLKSAQRQETVSHNGEKDDLAAIIYSGGTSGTTKGVMLTNANFNALSAQTNAVSGCKSIAGMKMLALMPLSHGFGLGVGMHTPLTNGAASVLIARFTPKSYAEILKKNKPEFIFGVPTLFENMINAEAFKTLELSFLRGVFCGGDSLSPDLKRRFDGFLEAHGASVQIREGYGASECLAVSCLTPPHAYREGSIGLPVPNTSFKIVKPETEETLPFGEIGEIVINGPTVMKGYMNEPKETASALRVHSDGKMWLHTGDLGTMDTEGFVYFKQRMKRMIISSGYNIYPSQLENVINSHPKVKESCVIGVKDPYRIQRVKAFVVPAEGQNGDLEGLEKELKEFFALNIAKYAIPREIEFKTALPRTAVGKTDYRALETESKQKDG